MVDTAHGTVLFDTGHGTVLFDTSHGTVLEQRVNFIVSMIILRNVRVIILT